MKKIVIALLIISLSALPLFAAVGEKAGKVAVIKGKANLHVKGEARFKRIKKAGTDIHVNNIIKTKRDTSLVFEMLDGSKVALDEKSSLFIDGLKKVSPTEGKVVFSIVTQNKAKGVKVGLKTAVIGVKGTQFAVIVEQPKEKDGKPKTTVFLKEGKIGVVSLEGEFKRFKRKEIDEYEAFVKKQMGEYEEWVNKQEQEFSSYVKEFDLDAGKAITISGNEVKDADVAEKELDRLFDLFNNK